MKRIPLTQGQEALVDDEDYEALNAFKWQAQFDDTSMTWYAVRSIVQDGVQLKLWMHREIIDPPDDMDVDHIDHNGINNQRHNMRQATPSQNKAHKRAYENNTTGFRGVSKHRNRFQGYVRCDGVAHTAGTFDTAEEAARARDVLAKELFGEFATLNFPGVEEPA